MAPSFRVNPAFQVEHRAVGIVHFISPSLAPVLLLIGSNVFMTFAWYGHLKYTDRPLLLVILVSWAIALFEYCLAVPANRIVHAVYSTAELKVMQEVITLCVFAGFSVIYLGERLTLNHLVGFALICAGAFVLGDVAIVAPLSLMIAAFIPSLDGGSLVRLRCDATRQTLRICRCRGGVVRRVRRSATYRYWHQPPSRPATNYLKNRFS